MQWGARPEPGSGIRTAVAFDEELFHSAVLGLGEPAGPNRPSKEPRNKGKRGDSDWNLLPPMLSEVVTLARLESHIMHSQSDMDAAVDWRSLLRTFRSSVLKELAHERASERYGEAARRVLDAAPRSIPAQMVSPTITRHF